MPRPTAEISMLDLYRNPHMTNLAAIVRLPFMAPTWRADHPTVPFWSLLDDLVAVAKPEYFKKDRTVIIERLTNLLTAIVQADPRLRYSEDDLSGFLRLIDSEHGPTILSLFCAKASSPDQLLTPVEAAQHTGLAEITWRKRAIAGEVPGAFKKGKQWLLSASVLRAAGYNIPYDLGQQEGPEPDELEDDKAE